MKTKYLSRHPDGPVAGICEGIGRHFDVDPTIVRVIWAVAILFFGTGLILYGLLWWIVPREGQAEVIEATSDGKLRRTGRARKIFGVCGGIARYYDVDPTIVRLGAIGAMTLSAGTAFVAYLAAALFMSDPEDLRPIQL